MSLALLRLLCIPHINCYLFFFVNSLILMLIAAMPQFLDVPQDMQAISGEDVTLHCNANGLPKPELIWMYNTNEISVDQAPHMQIMPSGALRINSVDTNDIGIYECIARNEMGEVKSPPVRMMVHESDSSLNSLNSLHTHAEPAALRQAAGSSNQVWVADAAATPVPPHFTLQPHDQIVALHRAGHVLLDCAASGWPLPDIQWFVNGRQLSQSTSALQLQANGSLVLLEPSQLTAGTYRCEAHNRLGSVQASARIEVKGE